MKHIALFAAALALSACATTNTYAPADRPGGTGYDEVRIENDRYRVTYTGSQAQTGMTGRDLALLRAAELTLDAGYDWFEVVGDSRDRQQNSNLSTGVRIGQRIGGYRRSGTYGAVSVGVNDLLKGQEKETVILEILMGEGEPLAGGRSYDAAEVFNNLRPQAE